MLLAEPKLLEPGILESEECLHTVVKMMYMQIRNAVYITSSCYLIALSVWLFCWRVVCLHVAG